MEKHNFDLCYSKILKGIAERNVTCAVPSLPFHVIVRKQRPIKVIYMLCYQS